MTQEKIFDADVVVKEVRKRKEITSPHRDVIARTLKIESGTRKANVAGAKLAIRRNDTTHVKMGKTIPAC